MSGEAPSKTGMKPTVRRRVAVWLAAGGVVAAGLLYIILAVDFKPNAHFARGWAGEAVSTGPATVSEADPGSMHVIPPLSARGVGQLAPDVKFVGADGSAVGLADFRGKVVLLNLWATWCAPCRAEMPNLAALQKAYAGKDLVVLMPPADQALLKLCYEDEFTMDEIAQMLALPPGTVKSRLYSARHRLRDLMENNHEHD